MCGSSKTRASLDKTFRTHNFQQIFPFLVKINELIAKFDILTICKWLLKLNVSTCKVVSYCTKDTINTSYHITEGNAIYNWDKVESITDLGVNFDKKLSFTERVQQKINKAYSMVVIICIIELLYYCI